MSVFQSSSLGLFRDLVGDEAVPRPRPLLDEGGRYVGADVDTHATTVIAVKYKDGVINIADRRATAGNTVMYDQAEKIMALDDHMLISISGSFAKSVEVVRYLRHAFKYYERSQLQAMSLDGKLQELSRVIANNVPAALQGIGAFIPIVSTFEAGVGARIFFYDVLGGQFESADFGAAGSGSGPIRGVFEYIIRTKGPFREMDRESALKESLTMLEIAAELDTATGGSAKYLPAAKYIVEGGVYDFSEDEIKAGLGRA